MEKFETKTEKFSDKEKLEQVQDFVKEMNQLWRDQWDKTISNWDSKLQIESNRWDGWSYAKFILTKNGKEIFNYDMSADMFRKDRAVWITIKIDWKTMSYSWDENNKHWIYNNYQLLEKAKTYQKEILSMIEINNNQKKENALKKEIKNN